jgi:hypothetical protein
VIAFVPRPGRVALAPYPLTPTGEVELRMMFQRPGQRPRGLSALQVQVLDAGGRVAAEGRTEFDGSLVLEGLRPGAYTVRLDPDQAARLGLSLAEPLAVRIAPGGGFAGRRTAMVVAAPQRGDGR